MSAPALAPVATTPQRRPAPLSLPPLPLVDSTRLFAGVSAIQILHGDAVYTLRITRLGKLILTK